MTSREALAVNGGDKLIQDSFPNRGHFGREEKAAAMKLFDKAVESGTPFGYSGEQEDLLCSEFADFLGGGYADGVNSGTTAVYVGLRALEPEPFSEVIVCPVTDPGGIMPIVMCDCIPVIADSRPGEYNTGPEQIEACITDRTSAIVVAHIGGEPVDMEGIMAVAAKYGLPVVEDCSQSHAAEINGKYVGSFGTVAAFSIMFGKHFCCGGQGGIVFTKDHGLYLKVRHYSDRGKGYGLEGNNGNVVASLNFNMDELHAAIGRVQLRKLTQIVAKRREFVQQLIDKGFGELESINVPVITDGGKHSYWWWRLEVNVDKLTCSKDEFIEAVEAEGVPLISNYAFALPHTFDWFQDRSSKHPWNNPRCQGEPSRNFSTPNVQDAMTRLFNLRIFESWGKEQADAIIAAFKKVENCYLK
ncbi:DegT/DnrJ/EryC1/StrS family aminotransferase [Lentisphaerota bacterium ZTH]|nr:DegT/DnrJ/EryC1/StrS family aminotransferase [Lentisphaerota bacterium]WET05552.1 DegT/DnrJ/EryC1/StrS family aminotransferase [Lentisphaerota bacterium ZTH]